MARLADPVSGKLKEAVAEPEAVYPVASARCWPKLCYTVFPFDGNKFYDAHELKRELPKAYEVLERAGIAHELRKHYSEKELAGAASRSAESAGFKHFTAVGEGAFFVVPKYVDTPLGKKLLVPARHSIGYISPVPDIGALNHPVLLAFIINRSPVAEVGTVRFYASNVAEAPVAPKEELDAAAERAREALDEFFRLIRKIMRELANRAPGGRTMFRR